MFARSTATKATYSLRAFSTSSTMAQKLRIGYVPEHFSTPLHFAQKHYRLDAELIPEPLGTGALTSRLKSPDSDDNAIDVAIGLTEGFVSDLGKSKAAGKEQGFGLVGTYVESPLCWAISTGAQRGDVSSISDLKGKKVGVSRIGSGSYVMSFVLADQQGWLQQGGGSGQAAAPFGVEVIGDFAALRKAVQEKKAEFFMWEHFTTKHYWDNGELKRIGEIYTPWPSWMIAARSGLTTDKRLEDMAEKINRGRLYYEEHAEEAVEHITSTMKYSKEDAEAWMKTVQFTKDVRGVDPGVVDKTVGLLRKAGVLDEKAGGVENMVSIKRAERAKTS
ncbi:hypothetical protein BTJ68_08801 [Hortaea werneckii EXF-2000]|uniref:Ca3427-like PBP 2 domain-containing protein n=2 Tax=Hortaea werneckii TaxID=91943 RepID=A0A3M7IJU7_HORWE|nr:hypothetical protein BTJ68_08801 [Hortaea werneckii EXF-2000]RMZ25623.1 hypothetical protein D0859_10324 [Hortaea werneckii]